MKKKRRFVGPDGEFVSTHTDIPEGHTNIGYLQELCEWLYYHNTKTDKEKLKDILAIEKIIQDLLNGNGKIKDAPFGVCVKYIPTWSKKLKDDTKQRRK